MFATKGLIVMIASALLGFLASGADSLADFSGYDTFSFVSHRFNEGFCQIPECTALSSDLAAINDCIAALDIRCGFTVSASKSSEELVIGETKCSNPAQAYFNLELHAALQNPFVIPVNGTTLDGYEEFNEVTTRFVVGQAALYFVPTVTSYDDRYWSVAINASFSTETAPGLCSSEDDQASTFIDYPFHGSGRDGKFLRALVLDRVPTSLMVHPTWDQYQLSLGYYGGYYGFPFEQLVGSGFVDGEAVTGTNITLTATRLALRVQQQTTTSTIKSLVSRPPGFGDVTVALYEGSFPHLKGCLLTLGVVSFFLVR